MPNPLRIYLASPFFNERELAAVERAEQLLRGRGYEVFSPREHEVRDPGTPAWSAAIFKLDREAIEQADRMVMLYHGAYSDSGTAWECGCAFALGKPVVAVQLGQDSNLMVHESVAANITLEQLADYDFDTMPPCAYSGPMM